MTFRRFVQLLPSCFFCFVSAKYFFGVFPRWTCRTRFSSVEPRRDSHSVAAEKKREVVREGGTLKDLFIYFNFVIGIGVHRPTSWGLVELLQKCFLIGVFLEGQGLSEPSIGQKGNMVARDRGGFSSFAGRIETQLILSSSAKTSASTRTFTIANFSANCTTGRLVCCLRNHLSLTGQTNKGSLSCCLWQSGVVVIHYGWKGNKCNLMLKIYLGFSHKRPKTLF